MFGLRKRLPHVQDARHEGAADRAASELSRTPVSHARAGGSPSNAPLDGGLRAWAEPQFGDLSGVRVHADAEAANQAGQLGASAFTIKDDIYFGRDQYRPETSAGRALIGHELAHTAQQRGMSGPGVVQKQPAPAQPPAVAKIGADEIFPFPVGSDLLIANVVREFDPSIQPLIISRLNSDEGLNAPLRFLAKLLVQRGLKTLTAKVVANGADEFKSTFSVAKIPAQGDLPEVGPIDCELGLKRTSDNDFTLVFRYKGAQEGSESMNLTAKRSASGDLTVDVLTTDVPNKPGYKNVKTYSVSKPDKDGRTVWSGDSDIGPLSLVAISPLKAGEEGKQQLKKADEVAAPKPPRGNFYAGIGAQFGPGGANFGASAGFRMYLTPLFPTARLPLQVQLDYTPKANTGLVTGATGLDFTFGPKVPLDVRILGGAGAGAVPSKIGGTSTNVYGPLFGAGVGVEIKSFRIYVDYAHLFNVAKGSESINTLLSGVGFEL